MPRGLRLPQPLDEPPDRQGPQQGVLLLPQHVRRRVGEQRPRLLDPELMMVLVPDPKDRTGRDLKFELEPPTETKKSYVDYPIEKISHI